MDLSRHSFFCLTLLDDREFVDANGPIPHQWFAALLKWGEMGLSVTLALSRPGASPTDQAEAIAAMGHEVALLGNAAWVDGSRGKFAKGLLERLATSSPPVMSPSSLVVPDAQVTSHLDLLVKHGIRAIVDGDLTKGVAARENSPFFGLWRVPITLQWSSDDERISASILSRARRAVRRATMHGGMVHLAVPTKTLLADGKTSAALTTLLESVTQFSRRGVLSVQTLSQHAGAIAIGQKSTPARSILRAA